MVGLVLVSHSRELADALIALVKQVSSKEIPLVGAAGVGPERQEFGTDAVEIAEAIQSVYSSDGVVVLMDLGSAILSAETALEFLPENMRPNIRLCAAPIVEGAIFAGVQSSLGSDLETVCREAQQALLPKIDQLSPSEQSTTNDQMGTTSKVASISNISLADTKEETPQEIILTINTQHGLHARPAARFVQTAAEFDAEIQVAKLSPLLKSPLGGNNTSSPPLVGGVRGRGTKQPEMQGQSETCSPPPNLPHQGGGTLKSEGREVLKGPVPATSLTSLATLGVVHSDQIVISARGREATQALEALKRLVEENFGENIREYDDDFKKEDSRSFGKLREPNDKGISAIPISDGIAIGPAFQYQTAQLQVLEHQIDDPASEWECLQNAIVVVRQAIQQRRQQVSTSLGNSQAAIFDAHLLTLEDTVILEQTRKRIFQNRANAAAAWKRSIEDVTNSYKALPDPYLQQRSVDVLDVGNQVLFALLGQTTSASPTFSEPVILIAQEITPTLIAQLDPTQVLGLVTVIGGPTSHSAILARNLGIPAIVVRKFPSWEGLGVGSSPFEGGRGVLDIPPGTIIAIDGFKAALWVNPDPQRLEELNTRRTDWISQREKLLTASHQPAITSDGHHMKIAANAGSILDAKIAIRHGAEAIGVLRTEFLYLTRNTPRDVSHD
jgi:dihydroxyacetone kinase phosphotransfer subunit